MLFQCDEWLTHSVLIERVRPQNGFVYLRFWDIHLLKIDRFLPPPQLGRNADNLMPIVIVALVYSTLTFTFYFIQIMLNKEIWKGKF